jgi:RNA polymerase sigma-70 factor (ECF subfamily)
VPDQVPDDEITRSALAAKAGDRAAAEAFVRATQRDVQRMLAHLCGPAEADDLTQETFLRAMRSLPGFAGRSSARTWLLSIARRVAVDHVRSAVRRPRTTALEEWTGHSGRASGAASNGGRAGGAGNGGRFEDGVLLRRLVDALAPDRREAFVATQILGLSYAEAAQVCDCPVGTIRSRVARAREDLTAALSVLETRAS